MGDDIFQSRAKIGVVVFSHEYKEWPFNAVEEKIMLNEAKWKRVPLAQRPRSTKGW